MQKIQLSIPEPCHENWQHMNPTEKGRFCNACAKEVIDFSVMTDNEVLQFFTKRTDEKVCGRAYPDQLNRTISIPAMAKRPRFRFWNYAAALLLLFSRSASVKAQTKGKVVSVPNKPATCSQAIGGMIMIPKDNSKPVIVSGKVVDEKGNPVIAATVMTGLAKVSSLTDNAGNFRLAVSATDKFLEVSAVGYNVKQCPVAAASLIVLEKRAQQYTLGAMVSAVQVNPGGVNNALTEKYCITQFEVKDELDGQPIKNAEIEYAVKYDKRIDTGRTDNKGKYKLKRSNDDAVLVIKIKAEGYLENTMEINSKNFTNRKEVFAVNMTREPKYKEMNNVVVMAIDIRRQNAELGYATVKATNPDCTLTKPSKKPEIFPAKMTQNILSNQLAMNRAETIRLREVQSFDQSKNALLVVDGVPYPISYLNSLNPNDIDNVYVLKEPTFAAPNGVIIVTTKKNKVTQQSQLVKDSIAKSMVNKLADKMNSVFRTNTMMVYPDPVQKGNAFFVMLKLKQADNNNIQIADPAGRICFKKLSVANTPEYIERIQTDANWARGVYFISVFDPHNKLICKTSFMVQ